MSKPVALAPPNAVRYAAVTSLWSYATLDRRLTDAQLRIYLTALAISNTGQGPSLAMLATLLDSEREQVAVVVKQLVALGYMIDRQEGVAA